MQIDEKTVSRQHLQIILGPVDASQPSQGEARSRITIKCLETKFGTSIDGEGVPPGDHDLNGNDHNIKLGKSTHPLRIAWLPVILSFSFGSKELKRGKDPLKEVRKRLENTDIVCVLDYLPGQTTHVVAGKRNTAKGLQALVNGRYMVHTTYIDALIYCTTPENLDEPESFCPLELDFDQHWPDPLQYLPPKSKEPLERPVEDFAPNPRRAEVFDGYAFVFCEQVQFDALQAPITDGGGKALYFAVDPGTTEAVDLIRYAKSVAGEKGLGEFEDGSEGKGVVIVKPITDKEPDWAARFVKEVSLTTGQRMIEQNEFLEAILSNNASGLRRPLPIDDDSGPREGPQSMAKPSQPEPTQTAIKSDPSPTNLRERRARRAAMKKQFKAFDDEYDDSSIPAPEGLNHGTQSPRPSSSVATQRKRRGFDDDIDDDEPDQSVAVQATQVSQPTQAKKRPAPEEEDEEMIDAILPAAAALKRRRIEEKDNNKQQEKPVEPLKTLAEVGVKKPKKEIDIKDAVRKRREAEEEAARRDEEFLKETLDGMDVSQMRNLAVVEEMELPDRTQLGPQRRSNGVDNNRWDPKWNGRKNFKGFRRQGQGNQARRGETVIVHMEEVKKKGYGIGEEYWLDSDKASKRKRKDRDRNSQVVSSQQVSSNTPQQLDELQEVPPELIVEGQSSEIIDVDAPRQTRQTHQSEPQDSGLTSQQQSSTALSNTTKATAPPSTSAAKRPRTFMPQQSDSDSEDDMKFRFKRRR